MTLEENRATLAELAVILSSPKTLCSLDREMWSAGWGLRVSELIAGLCMSVRSHMLSVGGRYYRSRVARSVHSLRLGVVSFLLSDRSGWREGKIPTDRLHRRSPSSSYICTPKTSRPHVVSASPLPLTLPFSQAATAPLRWHRTNSRGLISLAFIFFTGGNWQDGTRPDKVAVLHPKERDFLP